MSDNLRRILELSGQRDKNQVVTSLYENYGIQGPVEKGLEGPFKMKNGRVVHYNVNEGTFVDVKARITLIESEVQALYEEETYEPTVVLHAKRGDETLSLRLEGIAEMKPMVALLRNNGYDDFEMSDDGEEPVQIGDLPHDEDPDGEMIRGQLKTALRNAQAMLDTIGDQKDFPAWWNAKVTKAVDYLDVAHDYLMGKLDVDADGEVDSMELEPQMEGEVVEERKLSDAEKEKLDRLKKKHEGGSMHKAMHKQYGKEQGDDVFYGKLTKMAKEGLEEFSEEELNEARDRDERAAQSLSRKETKANKKAANAKSRQKGRKQSLEEYAKGDKVMYKGKEVTVSVPDAQGDQVGIDKGDGKVDLVDGGELSAVVKEDAVNATVYDNQAMPADAVDDMEQKAERTGQADRTETKNVVPKEVMQAIDKRIAEVKASIERYDGKGYNEKSVKVNVVDALQQIRKNLARGDHEGFMEAQIFFGTLMSPIWDMIPAQVVNYLAKGDDSENPDAA